MNITYLEDVEVFVYSLQKQTQTKILRLVDLLRIYGRRVGMPHVKSLQEGLFELRVRGQQEIRMFFICHNDEVIFLHGFVKKTQQTPRRELEKARKRKESLTKR